MLSLHNSRTKRKKKKERKKKVWSAAVAAEALVSAYLQVISPTS
jgi:hypothetical protein